MNLAGYIISIPIAISIIWMVWNYVQGNINLVSRLKEGDLNLLNSSRYNVTEAVRAPAGSRIENIQPIQIQLGGGGFTRVQLPDGRIGLLPTNSGVQMVRSVPETMHNNQHHQ